MAESDATRTISHEMKAVPVLVALAVVAAPGAAGQDRLPAAARLVDARACGAAPVGPGAVLTITPDGDGLRDCAALRIRHERPSSLELVVLQRKPRPGVVDIERVTARAGVATLVWSPPPATAARTYPTRIVVKTDGASAFFAGPVVRIHGLTARFERETYGPGAVARLRVDGGRAASFEIVDAATGVSVRGVRAVGGPVVGVLVGSWKPGVYAARFDHGGTVVQAPLVVRAPARSRPRVAVVLPTSTWQAYNFTDGDGDGTGDTWYASRRRESARLDRPFMGDGMPPFFNRYDRPFLRWLRASGHDADFLGDDDLDRVRDAATLLRRYDLLVFPGHHEYGTLHERDLVERYRDGGGNLAFLSADAFTGGSNATEPCCDARSSGGAGNIRAPSRRSSASSTGRATTAHTAPPTSCGADGVRRGSFAVPDSSAARASGGAASRYPRRRSTLRGAPASSPRSRTCSVRGARGR
jgi:hypothetical protein